MKTALITGSTSGIGEAYAEYYAEEGFNLVLVSRTEQKLQTQKERLEKHFNTHVIYIVADLSQEYIARDIFEILRKQNLFIDVLINNAGIGFNGDVDKLSLEKQHHETFLNSLSVIDMCHLFVGEMKKRREGTVINIASTTAYYPVPHMAVYAASKAFVLSFTEALHAECRLFGIDVLSVSPGPTNTNFFDDDRGIAYGNLRQPADVVKTTTRGLKRNRASVIDGAVNRFMSAYLPRILSRKYFLGLINQVMSRLVL